MATRTIAVLGASGNVGGRAAAELLERGLAVVAIGRDAKKLEALAARGARTVSARFDDASALADALTGCDAAFAMLPPDLATPDVGAFQDRVGSAICGALARARVAEVVSLSSIGAEREGPTGPLGGLRRQEARLDALAGVRAVHLRAGYFLQNFHWSIATIREHGAIFSSLRGDLPLWMVSTDDVGRAAAALLAAPLARTGPLEVTGPRSATLIEAAAAIAGAAGRPVAFVPIGYEQQQAGMEALGIPRGAAACMVEMHRAHNDGLVGAAVLGPERRVVGAIGLAQFAQSFAQLAHLVR